MNKKTNNYSKQMEIKVKATFTQRNKSVTKELTAKIDTESFTFKAISDFQKDLSKINTYIKKLTIDNVFFEMTVCIAEYDYTNWEQTKKIETRSFNFWEFKGYNPFDENERGVYLKADTRYTPENEDIWYDFTLESLPEL